ncbi:mannan endo-1,6-alpha-mannosidase [Geosmithia morbida]|uniref:mannan endo-1,6-alpha-mannosidase n=1 Tax=Geosmithia morbida TaxID=1094350 RepID=A0A9P4YYN9_9HYPO|nr:mannan endo-1,6-alpha-mannosidase [Geosmithia morbida]KAF4124465.1 mannan endo-1,6-alpha-mannosidase [Geosmithia morbida]
MHPLRCRGGRSVGQVLVASLLATNSVLPVQAAFNLDTNSKDGLTRCAESVTSVAKQLTKDMMSFYHGNEPGNTPGLLPEPPYYWWEGGALMGTLIEYWYYTKDEQYVSMTQDGLLAQKGENDDYMPDNQTLTEGNDDQGFWALSVMSAAEYNFPHPGGGQPSWLALAQAVFNTQAPRWDESSCGGGLRWQIFEWNKGWDYKNSISAGTFYALAARLALYTGNSTYTEWAEKTYDWMTSVKFIDDKFYVYDGAHIPNNCTNIVPYQFTYNAGCFIHGSAAMYNLTEDEKWKTRLDNLLDGADIFFRGSGNDVMEEVSCESSNQCNTDQESFKAYLSRWLAATTQWVPSTYERIIPKLRGSAEAAIKQCTGGDNGRLCGLRWSTGKFDGTTGVGPQMAAVEIILSCNIKYRARIFTSETGGTSKGDPSAGGKSSEDSIKKLKTINGGDTAGAAIVTILILSLMLAALFWLFMDEASGEGPLDQVKGGGASILAVASLASGRGQAHDDMMIEKSGLYDKSSSALMTPANVVTVDNSFNEGIVESRHSRRSAVPTEWAAGGPSRSSGTEDQGSSSDQPSPCDQRSGAPPRALTNDEIHAVHTRSSDGSRRKRLVHI